MILNPTVPVATPFDPSHTATSIVVVLVVLVAFDPELPILPNERTDDELPKCKKSSTDIETFEPSPAIARAEPELPRFPTEPTDDELPKCKRSGTGIETLEPNPAIVGNDPEL